MQKIVTPGGETLVVIPLAEYEALLDAADIGAADKVRTAIAEGRDELVPAAIASRLLGDESPVRVWREHRGMTASALAERAGISAGYLSELENGKKSGSIAALGRLAGALNIAIEDLL
jgi:DNA-binding XRE family transcriptional regulator